MLNYFLRDRQENGEALMTRQKRRRDEVCEWGGGGGVLGASVPVQDDGGVRFPPGARSCDLRHRDGTQN